MAMPMEVTAPNSAQGDEMRGGRPEERSGEEKNGEVYFIFCFDSCRRIFAMTIVRARVILRAKNKSRKTSE